MNVPRWIRLNSARPSGTWSGFLGVPRDKPRPGETEEDTSLSPGCLGSNGSCGTACRPGVSPGPDEAGSKQHLDPVEFPKQSESRRDNWSSSRRKPRRVFGGLWSSRLFCCRVVSTQPFAALTCWLNHLQEVRRSWVGLISCWSRVLGWVRHCRGRGFRPLVALFKPAPVQ